MNRYILRISFALALFFALPALAQDVPKGKALFFKGAYEDAVQALRGKHPTPESLTWLTLALQEQGEWVKAQNAILQFKSWQENAGLINRMGELKYAAARYDEARRHFEQALQVDPQSIEARVNLGEMLAKWGKKQEARELLQDVLQRYRTAASPATRLKVLAARACIPLNRFQNASNLLDGASKQAPGDWRILERWGRLFLDKYNFGEARSIFQQALKLNPNADAALIGLARSLELKSPGKSLEMLQALLEKEWQRLDVLLYAAELNLRMGNRKKAKEYLATALAKAPKHLELLTVQGQVALLEKNREKFEATAATVQAVNPAYSRYFTAAGEILNRNYLFEEAAQMYRRALAIDPGDADANAGLGTVLSRLAKLDAAQPFLERAFQIDPYNVWTGNLLNLFDSYVEYDTLRTEHFLIRLHKDDTAIIGPYATALAESAYAAMVPRYRLQIDFPVTLEIFPKHDDFAVRCFGLPGAQVFLGICFGPLITMDSPRARPVGSFNWMETLWHEFAHVVHLTLTHNRIPRWLAEGIAVYEASRANRAWDMNMHLAMIGALQKDDLIPLARLDRGFTGDPAKVTFSYYQASQIIGFIVEEYGFDKLLQLLDEFRREQELPNAVKNIFSMNLKRFDAAFAAYAKEKFSYPEVDFDGRRHAAVENAESTRKALQKMIEERPNLFFAKLRLANLLIDEDDFTGALPLLQQARDAFPEFVGDLNPYAQLARVYLAQGDTAAAVDHLFQLVSRNGKSFPAALQLARLADGTGRTDVAIQAYTTAIQIYPYEISVHKRLGAILLQQNRAREAVREFRVALALNPQDKAGVHCSIAEALLQLNQFADAKHHALLALEIAPTYERAQEILLKAAR